MRRPLRIVLLYLRTLLTLQPRQLAARLPHEWWVRRRKKLGWPAQPQGQELKFHKTRLAPPPPEELARHRAVAELWQKGIVEYLGQQGAAADYRAWHRPRLWRYERHYHSELVAFAAMALEEPAGPWIDAARDLVLSWSSEAPPEAGEAWEPYPTARRLLNWSEAAALEPRVATPLAFRLQVQMTHLLAHLEHHLRGNHLLCDAAALVASGSVLQGSGAAQALHRGIVLLEKELAIQVLPDGGYAERTVLYHALVLRDATLALQLARERGQPPAIKNELGRMALWLLRVRRADGSFPQVNDSSPRAQLVAQDAIRLAIRANLLGAGPLPEPAQVVDLPETGWTFLRDGGGELFFDRGPIGPREQPGHGHAGALAYELQWYGLPVVSDSGMTTYEVGPVRDFERSAVAHATVSVDGVGVDEVWHSFRVARRGTVERLPDPTCDARLRALRGRARSFRGWEHERWIYFWPGRALLVFDKVKGARRGAQIRSRVPLHPTWSAAESGKVFYLLGPGARGLQLQILRGEFDGAPRGQETPREGWASQGFQQPVPRTSVRLRPSGPGPAEAQDETGPSEEQALMVHAFFAPGVSWREAASGISLRAPGSEVLLKLEGGLPI